MLRLLAYLKAAEQVRGLEPVEQDLLRATEAALPLYRTPAEVSSFEQQLAAVLQADTAAGARPAEAVAHEQAAADLSDCVAGLPKPVLQRLLQLALGAGDLEAMVYLEAAL